VKMKGKTMQGKQYFGLGESAESADMQEVFEGAIPMARELAEHGHVMSQFSMGEAYLRGWGAPRDIKEAARWYRNIRRLNKGMRLPSPCLAQFIYKVRVFREILPKRCFGFKRQLIRETRSRSGRLAQCMPKGWA